MKSISIKAPAKINIGLNITGKRPDGFHDLWTLFYPLHDLYDVIIFRKSDDTTLIYDKSKSDLGENNLILKTIRLLEKATLKEINVEAELIKNIPIGAGLGGGSSDAAATLISLNELFDLKLSKESMQRITLDLGSDVPFFIKAKPAIGKSRGELLTPVDFLIKFPIVIVNPGIHISTNHIFSLLEGFSSDNENAIHSPKSFDEVLNFQSAFNNDFEKIVFHEYPEIAEIKSHLYKCNAGYASMTGTGSTVYGIFRNEDEAGKAVTGLPDNYYKFISLPQEELM